MEASAGASSVPAQSQVAGSSLVAGSSSATALEQNRLPFDISTIALQSRVTVNLGARDAQPTERKR
jgi:hypothetical protein